MFEGECIDLGLIGLIVIPYILLVCKTKQYEVVSRNAPLRSTVLGVFDLFHRKCLTSITN